MKYIILVFRWIGKIWFKATDAVHRFDVAMRSHYRPKRLALAALGVIAALLVFMLLIPPYLGLSNDGSLDSVMADVGLARINPQDTTAYFSFYERTYNIEENRDAPGTTPMPLRVVIRAAIMLDTLFTNDAVFDMRFLSALYIIAYLALLYPLLSGMLVRVPVYSEGLLLAILSVLVFGDSTIAVRFGSLYSQPLECLFILAIIDMVFVLSRGKSVGIWMTVLALAVLGMMFINKYCALLGIIAAAMFWRLMDKDYDMPLKMLCICLAFIMAVSSVILTNRLVDQQTRVAKYNQMTRGVLFQADNPTKALEFFEIEPRYSVLTDTYGDQEFPVVLPDDGVLDEGFFDHYDTLAVLRYYVSHPMALMGMFDRGVHQAFITRSDYSGNYEQSVGLPKMAKTPFMSIWSTFKSQSAPQTAGVVLLLALAVVLLRHGKRGKNEDEQAEDRYKQLLAVFIIMAVVELLTVVVMGGDSELLRESFAMSLSIDVLAVLFLTELLHRTKNIELDKE